MKKNLKILTVFGIMWTGLAQFATTVFQFVVIMILARLLSPADFGIVGLAAIFSLFVNTISDLGLSAAIIQRKDLDEIHLSTSFWTNVGLGIILFILSVLASTFIADFFNEELLKPILIISSIGFIIGSFSIVHRALLEKNLNFKNITMMVEVPAAFASGITSIFLAFNGLGIWSLVFGSLCGSLITVIILWKINTWRPLFKFSYAHFKELFGYGSRFTGSTVLYYVGGRIDSLVIGKFFGPILLGYYTLANTLATIPQQKISFVVIRVMFPAFSIIQENNEDLREGYYKVVEYISVITFPMMAGMFVLAPEFVTVFYGMKWAPMVITLQILCLAGALLSIDVMTSTILFSKGRVDIQFKLQLFFAIVMPIGVITGTMYGIEGVASAISIMTFFLLLINLKIINKLISLNMYTYLKKIFPAIIGSIILIVILEIYKGVAIVYNIEILYILLSSIFIGILTYLIIMRLFFSYLFNEMKQLIHEMRRLPV